MVVMSYLSRTKDDTANMLCLTRACSDDVFPTGVIDLSAERIKTIALSAGLPPSHPQSQSQILCGQVGAGNMYWG